MLNTSEDNDGREVSKIDKQSRTITAQLVSAKLLEERVESIDNHMVLYCTVQTTYDPDQVKNKLQAIMDAQKLQKQLDQQNAQIEQLKKQIAAKPTAPTYTTPPPVIYNPPVTYNYPVTYTTSQTTYYTPKVPRIATTCILGKNYMVSTPYGPVTYTCIP